MVIWVFAGGGETELKGLILFLRSNFPTHNFQRYTPIRRKKGPKPGKKSRAYGKTGKDLARQIGEILPAALSDGNCDSLMVLDDLDCRDEATQANLFNDAIDAIPETHGLDRHIAFAAPEIESWLIADWDHTFAADPAFRSFHEGLRHSLSSNYGLRFDDPESFSTLNKETNACREKMSEKIMEAVYQLSLRFQRPLPHYSKQEHSGELLTTARAEIIRDKCPIFRKMDIHLNALPPS